MEIRKTYIECLSDLDDLDDFIPMVIRADKPPQSTQEPRQAGSDGTDTPDWFFSEISDNRYHTIDVEKLNQQIQIENSKNDDNLVSK